MRPNLTQPSKTRRRRERIIEEIRGKIEGRVYESLQAKRDKAEAFLHELAAEPARVRRLAGWDWIQEADSQLPN